MPPTDEFRASVRQWKNATAEGLDALARVAVQDLSEAVVDDTPVDTGFLVGNWLPQLGEPNPGVFPLGTKFPPGIAAIRIGAVIPHIKAGDIYYMTNGTHYARFVEYGTSHMAGRFYMTKNVQNWQGIVDAAAAKVGLAK